jgi:4-amino-4-deoxy-L-arabinose transferase-like glycosyltransferase
MPKTARLCFLFVVAAIILVHLLLLKAAADRDSPAWDEVGHLAAGITHWRTGEFDLYRVNPPFVRMISTLPLLASVPSTERFYHNRVPRSRNEFLSGRDIIEQSGARAFHFFTVARTGSILLSLCGACICFLWAKALYGGAAGLVAVLLWSSCPNILAHGHLITPDAGAAAVGVIAGFAFWRWLREPNWLTALFAGIMLGVCETTKTTWIILLGLWPILWIVYSKSASAAQLKQLCVILLVAVYIINIAYGFEGAFTQLRDFVFVSSALSGENENANGNRFANHWIGSVPVPLPRNYVLGIDHQKLEFERKLPSYLRGVWQLGGWYHYYLYACLIKVPLGTWLLGLLAVGMTASDGWRRKRRGGVLESDCSSSLSFSERGAGTTESKPDTEVNGEGKRQQVAAVQTTWRDEVVLLAPAVTVFVLVSSQTGFNHHLRYVLPVFPFVFIWISKVGKVFERPGRNTLSPALSAGEKGKPWRMWAMRGAVAGALGWSVVSSLSVYPHSLSYFNELVGGPKGGHWHLGSSNVDWGQDLLYLNEWYEEHPQARPLHLAYDLALVNPSLLGIEYQQVPSGPAMNRFGTPKTHNWPWGEVPDDPDLGVPRRSGERAALGPLPGWHVLSANLIHRRERDYEYFLEFEPVDWIGYSMMVFHITVDEANRVRRKLGMPELGGNDE